MHHGHLPRAPIQAAVDAFSVFIVLPQRGASGALKSNMAAPLF